MRKVRWSLPVVLKTMSRGFYRTFLGAKWVSDRHFVGLLGRSPISGYRFKTPSSSTGKEGHTWEHGPGTVPCVKSFRHTLFRVGKKCLCRNFLGVFSVSSEGKKGTYAANQGTYHLKLLFKFLFRTPDSSLPLLPFPPCLPPSFNQRRKKSTPKTQHT